MSRKAVNMTGERYGRLVCLEPLGSTQMGMVWKCICDCGNETEVVRGNLITSNVTSCGCFRQERMLDNVLGVKHGRTRRVDGARPNRRGTYSTWEAMHTRCYNPNSDWYHRYGGRGIKICIEWHDFENFLKDMGERPEGMTIDRIDVNGNYEPKNCRWATSLEQANNK